MSLVSLVGGAMLSWGYLEADTKILPPFTGQTSWLHPSLSVMIVFSLLFLLQKGKVYSINQTSRLTAAESPASLLFC